VVVVGLEHSGTREVALLLERLGIPMLSGTLECDQVDANTCNWNGQQGDGTCGMPEMDYEFPYYGYSSFLSKEALIAIRQNHTMCYERSNLDPSALNRELVPRVQKFIERARNCEAVWGTCPEWVGLKSTGLMTQLPAFLNAVDQNMLKVVVAVRDAREIGNYVRIDRGMQDLYYTFAPHLMKHATPYMQPGTVMGPYMGYYFSEFWMLVQLELSECVLRYLGTARHILVRYEELFTLNEQRRAQAIQHLRIRLGIAKPASTLEQLQSSFDTVENQKRYGWVPPFLNQPYNGGVVNLEGSESEFEPVWRYFGYSPNSGEEQMEYEPAFNKDRQVIDLRPTYTPKVSIEAARAGAQGIRTAHDKYSRTQLPKIQVRG